MSLTSTTSATSTDAGQHPSTDDVRPTLVIGATGKTGRRVAERLAAQGRAVRAGSRHAAVPFDWDAATTWPAALDGAGAAYIAYQPDLAFPGGAERIAGLVDVARRAGVRRLVLLSGRNEPAAQAVEAIVADAGIPWAVVQASFFQQNFSEGFFVDDVRAGVVAFPAGSVTEPFIDADDIADVAVAALTDDRHLGRVHELTGPELLTFADAVAAIAAATGRRLEYVPVTLDEYGAGMRAAGVPDGEVSSYLELFGEILDGRSSYVTDGVERILGRRPGSFADYARRTASTGVWGAGLPAPQP